MKTSPHRPSLAAALVGLLWSLGACSPDVVVLYPDGALFVDEQPPLDAPPLDADTHEGAAPPPDKDASASPSDDARVRVEVCNNGVDDDGNGLVDDGCPCLPGTTEPCYTAPAATLGVGACTSGTQRCEGTGEFGAWGRCEGAVTPEAERCGDGVDQDCNGVADDGPGCCRPGVAAPCYTGPVGTEGVGICRTGMRTCERDGRSWGSCLDDVVPRGEICDNGLDDDCDGSIDNASGCVCQSGTTRVCYPGPMSEAGVGRCRAGTQRCVAGGMMYEPCEGAVGPSAERCGNMLDDDCDGMTDEGCECAPGQMRACYPGPTGTEGVGRCRGGAQTCDEMGRWTPCAGAVVPSGEVCGNGLDDNCNGSTDEGCAPPVRVCTVEVSLRGDCVSASCPADCPYPIGCSITMGGDDNRGCVASTPTGSRVYFQEGNECGAGSVRGTLRCSNSPGAPLNAANCPINKSRRYYPTDRSGCPR